MESPLLSLCMIVRDEAELLPRCLGSAAPFVDETIVVDTGSQDGTADIARDHGARVLDHSWGDDFSEARNVSLEAARGQFVLVLDADEWIQAGCSPDTLRDKLRRHPEEAYSVVMKDRVDTGSERCYPLVRLFRNRPEHRYEGAIHEQITPSIARTLGVDDVRPTTSGLLVLHDGYLRDRVVGRDKNERNLRMLRRGVERSPDRPSTRYFLIRELVPMHAGRAVPGTHLDEALEHCAWLEGRTDGLPAPLAKDFTRLHAAALIAASRAEEAERLLEDRGADGVACTLLLADARLATCNGDPGPLGDALSRLRSCFDLDESNGLPFAESALAGPIVRARAAEALLRLGRHEEAKQMAAEAATLDGGGAAPWVARAAVERALGRSQLALRDYLEGLRADPYDPWAWVGLGEMLLDAGDPEQAAEPLTRAATLAPGWERAERALAEVRRAELEAKEQRS